MNKPVDPPDGWLNAFKEGAQREIARSAYQAGWMHAMFRIETKENEMPEHKEIPVVVTTEHRGVFFGYTRDDRAGKVIELKQAQMCVYWAPGIRGVLGLASTGPDSRCKVTSPVPALTLQGVTAVMEMTDEAVTAWQAKPWSRS